MAREYVVVGGGSSGIAVTLGLLERGCNVVLVERGEIEDPKSVCAHRREAAKWGEVKNCSVCSEKHLTAPQTHLAGRSLVIPTGKGGVGGSANLNAMLWSRGHPGVFDTHWPTGWSSSDLAPHFERVERYVGVRRVSAPVSSTMGTLFRSMFSSGIEKRSAGLGEYAVDKSTHAVKNEIKAKAEDEEAATIFTVSAQGQRRIALSSVLLTNAADLSGTLRLVTGAEVTALELKGNPADMGPDTSPNAARVREVVGVVTRAHGTIRPSGGGEVVLCAGVLATPRLLQEVGLMSCTSVLGVVDHSFVPVLRLGPWWTQDKSSSLHERVEYDDGDHHHIHHHHQSTTKKEVGDIAPAAAGHNGVHGLAYLNATGTALMGTCEADHSAEPPSTQVVLVDGGNTAALAHDLLLPHWPAWRTWENLVWPLLGAVLSLFLGLSPVRALLKCVYGALVCDVRPRKASVLSTGAGDSTASPCVDPRYLSDPQDIPRVILAVERVRRLLAGSSAPRWSIELIPGVLPVALCVKLLANSYYHPAGSCPMGDHGGQRVCDSQLRVLVDASASDTHVGLRVADASVLPTLPTGPPAATIMAVADRAAALITGEVQL